MLKLPFTVEEYMQKVQKLQAEMMPEAIVMPGKISRSYQFYPTVVEFSYIQRPRKFIVSPTPSLD